MTCIVRPYQPSNRSLPSVRSPSPTVARSAICRALFGAWLYIACSDDFVNHHPKPMFGADHLSVAYISGKNLLMHADLDKSADIIHMHVYLKLKKVITIKLSIQIKFGLHSYLFYAKIFKTRRHLPIFARYF